MSEEVISHPPPEDLLRCSDGELESERMERIARHLKECGECSVWLANLQDGEQEYAHTFFPAFKEAAAPPREPWFDLRSRLAEFDAVPPVTPTLTWGHRVAVTPFRWAAIAAGVALVMILVQWSSHESVSAAELLRKASSQESVDTRPRRPIRLKTKSGAFSRPALWTRTTTGYAAAESLHVLFVSANFSWDDPLSARSFSSWRNALTDRHDDIVKRDEPDGGGVYEIRTSSASGALSEARLTLRVSDLHPINETLRFRNEELVEITEIPGELPVMPSTPERPALIAEVQEPKITPGEELRVWAALHQLGADLGEPVDVEVDATRNKIKVSALGLGSERRASIERALNSMPQVELMFTTIQPLRSSPETATDSVVEAPGGPSLQQKTAEDFTNHLLEASQSALLRAYAIRKLGQRFPADVERSVSSEERALLTSLLSDHFAAFEAHTRRVMEAARQLAPMRPSSPAPSIGIWQSQAETLLAATKHLDSVLNQVLAVRGSDVSRQELTDALGRWDAEILAARAALQRRP
jgi:hypothetical protein